jgi:parvulin-like peptidyl-prolyl isomerase
MSSLRCVRAAALLWLPLVGCGLIRDPDPVLLSLGDQAVRRSEFESHLAQLQARGTTLTPDVRQALLEKFLEERALVLEARRQGLVRAGAAPEAERAAVERLLGDVALRQIDVGDPEVAAYFEAHVEEFRVPETVLLRQILVPTSNEARDVQRRLAKDPGIFEALARGLSHGPEAQQGGLMGPFSRGQLPQELEGPAFSLAVGAIGEVTTPLGYHVLKVEARQPAREASLDDARPGIRARLAREKSDLRVRQFVGELLSRAKVNHEAARPAPLPR